MTFLAGFETIRAGTGDFIRIPPGVTHDYWNASATRAGVLNLYIPIPIDPLLSFYYSEAAAYALITATRRSAVLCRANPAMFSNVP